LVTFHICFEWRNGDAYNVEIVDYQFLSRAAEREIQRLRMLKALERAAGSWKLKDHPELRHGAARWIAKLRKRDERLSRKRVRR